MAESLTIARPYAEAAFELARDLGALPSWSDALAQLSVTQVATLIADAAGQLSTEQSNFVHVLADNERLSVLPEIASQFEGLRNEFEGVIDAQISSAFPLSSTQIDDIVATLKGKYGREVKATVTVDSELIGAGGSFGFDVGSSKSQAAWMSGMTSAS